MDNSNDEDTANGTDAKAINHPWNAALYRHFKRNHTYNQICGGTLITKFAVMSGKLC